MFANGRLERIDRLADKLGDVAFVSRSNIGPNLETAAGPRSSKEAYAKRSRRPRAQASAVGAEAGQRHARLAKFFRAAAREADALADEAAFADKAAAADLLIATEAALSSMQRLRDLLSQQAGDQT